MQYFLYLMTVVVGLICLLNLLINVNYRSSKAINKFLIIIITVIIVRFLVFALEPYIHSGSHFKLHRYVDFLTTLLTPCIYLYFEALITNPETKKKRILYYCWIPLTYVLLQIILVKTALFDSSINKVKIILMISLVFYLIYIIAIFNLLNNYIWKKKSEMKAIEKQNRIIRNWVTFFYVILILAVTKNTIGYFQNDLPFYGANHTLYRVFGALSWLILFIILLITPEIIYGYNFMNKVIHHSEDGHLFLSDVWSADKRVIPLDSERDKKLQEKIGNKLQAYLQKIEDLALNTSFFTKHDLSIEDLSSETDIPVSHLNYMFRYHSRQSFNDLKRIIRIKAAVTILQTDERDITFEALASKAGFSSYTTFFVSFRSITGKTPQEFKSEVKQLTPG